MAMDPDDLTLDNINEIEEKYFAGEIDEADIWDPDVRDVLGLDSLGPSGDFDDDDIDDSSFDCD